MRKTSLEPQQKCCTQKFTPKTPNIRKITSVPKSEKSTIMHGLQPLQNRQFGSKIKMFKNMQKTSLEPQQKCSTQKSTSKTPNIPKIASVPKSEKFAIIHGLQPWENRQFGSKIKMFKNMRKTSLQPQQKYSTQKSTPKTPNIPKITSVPKSKKFAIMHWLQPLQNRQFGSKIKMFKNMGKTSLEPRQKCSTQKSSPKTRNIRKITSVPKSEKFGMMHRLIVSRGENTN